MKRLTLLAGLSIALFSCKKDETKPEPDTTPKWRGIYTSHNLKDNSTGAIVDASTCLNISSNVSSDSVRLETVIDEFGACFFHNVQSNDGILRGKISGNVATLDLYTFTYGGITHNIISGTITLNADNSATLSYTEQIMDTTTITRSYTGVFIK